MLLQLINISFECNILLFIFDWGGGVHRQNLMATKTRGGGVLPRVAPGAACIIYNSNGSLFQQYNFINIFLTGISPGKYTIIQMR